MPTLILDHGDYAHACFPILLNNERSRTCGLQEQEQAPTGWTPRIARKSTPRTSKRDVDDKKPVPKSRQRVEAPWLPRPT